MKGLFTLALLGILISCMGQDQQKYDLSFQKGQKVCAVRFIDHQQICFDKGYDPAISPDGLKLAYTKSEDVKSDFIRYIVVADLNSGKERKLNVDNNNYFGASWSPDGKYIAFNVFVDYNWQIGIIGAENSGFKVIPVKSDAGLFEPTWRFDSKSIIAHNLDTIFCFDFDGKILQTIDIRSTLGETYGMSSSTRFFFTPDGRYLVFNGGTDEEMKDVDGPVEALFACNLSTKEITRLSPKGMFASDLSMDSDGNILFSGFRENEKQGTIYRIDWITKEIKVIRKNGTRPSMSRNH